MSTRPRVRALILVFAVIVLLHFFVTWFLSMLGWTHPRADSLANLLWEPGGRLLAYLPEGKTAVMFAMFCSSLVWASTAVCLFWLGRRLFP